MTDGILFSVNVRCTQNDMIIRYHPRKAFQGKIYTDNHADECSAVGYNNGPTFLILPIGSPIKEQRCGISRAFDYETPNRTLIFTYVIIQNNPQVMMQSDRYIKVGCVSRFNRSSGSGMLDFDASKDYDDSGSLMINDGGDIPKLSVFILDAVDNTPVKHAKIGQILKFVISMESHTDSFDLRALNLTASSELDNVELIGKSGCPLNSAIFPALQQETTHSLRKLVSEFKAFKFSSSSQVKFNVSIQFCVKACKPNNCGRGIVSFGRRKRQTEFEEIVNKQIEPVVFPDDEAEASTLARIIFPDDDEMSDTTESYSVLEPVKFPGPVNEKLVTLPGVRVDVFGNPQGIQQYLGGINEIPDDVFKSKSSSQGNVVTVLLEVTLNVSETELNDQVYVAGLGWLEISHNFIN